jgi:competence protein ComEA
MPISLRWSRPPLLFGVAVFAAMALLLGREFLPPQDDPALVVNGDGGIRVALGEGFASPGVRQFHDGMTTSDVMVLTPAVEQGGSIVSPAPPQVLIDGMALVIVENPHGNRQLQAGWMPARQRLALGIPLHPDRMSRADWIALPGIGEQLATRIEVDRQKYGEFGRLEALERVKGIGPAKLQALRPYFVAGDK